MSINRALPSIRRDVAAIYAAPDHAALVAIYERLCDDFNPQDYADCERDGLPGLDLRGEDDMRQFLLDYMREMCSACNVHATEAGIRPEEGPDMPLYLREFGYYPAMLEAAQLIAAGWEDISWHNDACPHFASPDGVTFMWLEHPHPEARESGGERFTVTRESEPGAEHTALYEGDDWTAAITAAEGPEHVCPAHADPSHRPEDGGPIIGCGKPFRAEVDSEGIVDCPHCGIHFKAVAPAIPAAETPRKAGPGPCPTCPHGKGLHCRICWPVQYT